MMIELGKKRKISALKISFPIARSTNIRHKKNQLTKTLSRIATVAQKLIKKTHFNSHKNLSIPQILFNRVASRLIIDIEKSVHDLCKCCVYIEISLDQRLLSMWFQYGLIKPSKLQ